MSRHRLVSPPDGCTPTHYDLTLRPNLEDFTFSGKVVIQAEMGIMGVGKETREKINQIKSN